MRSGIFAIVALVGFCGAAFGQEPRPSPAICLRFPDGMWPATAWVDGHQIEGEPTWVGESEDGLAMACWPTPPWAARQYAATGRACNAHGCTDAVLADGSPGPAVGWRSAACRADLNDDRTVGGADFLPLSSAFGARCVIGTVECRPDLNVDGVVGGSDFARWAGLFGAACP